MRRNKEIMGKTAFFNYDTAKFGAADFAAARDSWRVDLCGDSVSNSLATIGMAELLNLRDLDSADLRASLNSASDAVALWGDVAPTTSGELKLYYDRVLRMAMPYGTLGCKGYHDADLLADVVYALDFLHDTMFGANVITDTSYRSWQEYDWWDWYVGAPCPLMDTLMIIEGGISKAQMDKYLVPVRFITSKMRLGPTPSEAMSRIVTLTPLALLTEDRALLATLHAECKMLLESHDSGDNMRRDFCCMTHGMPYNGAYGVINLSRIGKVVQILGRTPLAYKLENADNLKGMVRKCFAPIMHGGVVLAPMNGRAMQYDYGAWPILKELHYLFGTFGKEFDVELKRLIRANASQRVRQELLPPYGSGMDLKSYRAINIIPGTRFAEAPKTHLLSYHHYVDALTNDAYVSRPCDMAYSWYSGDTCVWHRHGCMAGVRMNSARTYGYECINGANGDGWYTGDGALYLYTDGAKDRFLPNWWKAVDKHFIPGTTVDDRTRESMFLDEGWRSNQHYVGTLTLDGKFAAATMDFESFHNEVDEGRVDEGYGRSLPVHHSTLVGKKSWCFFDRAIVCLGAEISAKDGYNVRTVVDNHVLCDLPLVVDGTPIEFAEGIHAYRGASKVLVPGVAGYVILDGALTIKFYNAGDRRVAAIYLDHGKDPTDATYAYVVLPGADLQALTDYDASDVSIISNNGTAQAAQECSSGIMAIAFRKACTLSGIHARQPMLAIRQGGHVSVCDPTQMQEDFGFSVDGTYLADAENAVASRVENGRTCFEISTDSAKGRAYEIKLK